MAESTINRTIALENLAQILSKVTTFFFTFPSDFSELWSEEVAIFGLKFKFKY